MKNIPGFRQVSKDEVARRTLRRLREAQAILIGHFVLSSMRHAGVYANVKRVFGGLYPRRAVGICVDLAAPYVGIGIDVVVGPESGAVPIALGVAKYLSLRDGRVIQAISAKKHPQATGMFFLTPPDMESLRGKRVLIVEDVITTGAAVKKVVTLCSACSAEVVGVACVVDRSGLRSIELAQAVGVDVYGLLAVEIMTWEHEGICPLCIREVQVDPTIGRGAVYLAAKH